MAGCANGDAVALVGQAAVSRCWWLHPTIADEMMPTATSLIDKDTHFAIAVEYIVKETCTMDDEPECR